MTLKDSAKKIKKETEKRENYLTRFLLFPHLSFSLPLILLLSLQYRCFAQVWSKQEHFRCLNSLYREQKLRKKLEKMKKKRATLLAREEKGRKGGGGGGEEGFSNGHCSESSSLPLDISLHPDFDLLSLPGSLLLLLLLLLLFFLPPFPFHPISAPFLQRKNSVKI